MTSEQLQKWALAAEIIGGIAVVVSLGVVAFELNQGTKQAELNTNALEITAYQSMINGIVNINSILVTDPDLARIELAARADLDSITDVERHRLDAFYRGIIRHGDMAYFQYQRGAFDAERLESVLGMVRAAISDNPAAFIRWEKHAECIE